MVLYMQVYPPIPQHPKGNLLALNLETVGTMNSLSSSSNQ